VSVNGQTHEANLPLFLDHMLFTLVSFQLFALDHQLKIQQLKVEQEEQQHQEQAPELQLLSVKHRSLSSHQPHIAASFGQESSFRTPSQPQSVAPPPLEVFSPPSAGKFAMQAAEGRVSSPLTPVSVSPKMIAPSSSTLLSSNNNHLGAEFEVSSAWGGTGLVHNSIATDFNAIKSDGLLRSRCCFVAVAVLNSETNAVKRAEQDHSLLKIPTMAACSFACTSGSKGFCTEKNSRSSKSWEATAVMSLSFLFGMMGNQKQ
jgi:hypothetical protein